MAENTSVKSGQWSPAKRKLIVFLSFTVIFLVLAYYNYSTFGTGFFSADPESADCIRANGLVTEIYASGGSSRKSRESYYLSYEYKVDGETYSSKDRVDYNIYNSTRLGAKVEICYMKDKPKRAAVIGNDIKGQDAFMVILVDLGVLAVIAFVIYRAIRKRKKSKAAA